MEYTFGQLSHLCPKQHDIPLVKQYEDNTFHDIHEKEDIYIYIHI